MGRGYGSDYPYSSFWYIVEDGEYQGRPQGQQVNYPNLFVTVDTIQNTTITVLALDSSGGVHQININPQDYISNETYVSLKNESMSTYDLGSSGNNYFNIFDLGDGEPFLFNADEFPQYTPTELTSKTHNGGGRSAFCGYKCVWNGVNINE